MVRRGIAGCRRCANRQISGGRKLIKAGMRTVGCVVSYFCITLSVLIGMLYLSALIPREWFRENLLASAIYMEENEDEFYRLREEDRRTEIHNYADAITFNIMYSIDGDDRWAELMISPFYSDMANEEYQMISLLKEAIEEEKIPDTIYDRYWHGMMMILRPLFCVFTITQIRMVMLIVLLALLFVLCIQLWKREIKIFPIALCIAAVFIGYPMLAMSMEYTPVWLIMLVVSLTALKFYDKPEKVLGLSVISGVSCAFFDFLTTETVAFVVPIAIVFLLCEKEDRLHSLWQGIGWLLSWGVAWCISYLATLFTKWIFSGIVLKQERISAALDMMLHRQGASAFIIEADRVWTEAKYMQSVVENGTNQFSQALTAILVNFRLLFGLSEQVTLGDLLTVFVIVLGVTGCFLYLFRRKGSKCILGILLIFLGMVPIVRIIVLNNHSLEHCFFVYRSLFGTMVCVITGIGCMIDWGMIRKVLWQRK